MSSSGTEREHIQIFNKFDPCCFSGITSSPYYDEITNSIIPLDSGNFEIILDDTHRKHMISDSTINLIIEKIS